MKLGITRFCHTQTEKINQVYIDSLENEITLGMQVGGVYHFKANSIEALYVYKL